MLFLFMGIAEPASCGTLACRWKDRMNAPAKERQEVRKMDSCILLALWKWMGTQQVNRPIHRWH